MPVKAPLHQTPAILRHDDELHPSVGNLLRLPSLIVKTFYPALRVLRGFGLRRRQCGGRWRFCSAKQDRRQENCFSDLSRPAHTPPRRQVFGRTRSAKRDSRKLAQNAAKSPTTERATCIARTNRR